MLYTVSMCKDIYGWLIVKIRSIEYRFCGWQKIGQLPGSRAPGNGLQEKGEMGPGLPSSGRKSQLEPSREGENVRRDREEPILDVMKEHQQPREWEYCYLWLLNNSKGVTVILFTWPLFFSFRRINYLVLNHLHGSSVNMFLILHVEQFPVFTLWN